LIVHGEAIVNNIHGLLFTKTENMKRLFLKMSFFFWVCILSIATVKAQENKLPAFITDSLDNYIKTAMGEWNIPGLSVAVVKDGKVVFMKGYGVTEAGGKEPVDENTLFMIGSNTKAFTATALSILQESGQMSMDDKVLKWMPEFRLQDSLATADLRICDLLSHRIGFETFQGDFTYWTSNLTRSEIIRKMSLIRAPYPFRTKWGYCNAAFVTAGELIPRITGRNWEDVVRDSILKPLQMDRTIIMSSELKNVKNIAYPHTIIDNKICRVKFANLDNLAAAGSIVSSASDMSHWLLTQLANGKFNNVQAIPPGAIQSIRQPYSIITSDPADDRLSHFYLYGLGISINDLNGEILYSHTGGVDGFLSCVMFMPEEQLGIVVLTNSDQNGLYNSLASEIRDSFLGLPFRNYSGRSLARFTSNQEESARVLDSLRRIVAMDKNPVLPLSNFTGRYTNELYGDIFISIEKDQLVISFSNHPDMKGMLQYIDNNSFLCTYSNPEMGIVEMPFRLTDGKVSGLTLRVSDFVEFLPYEFQKAD